MAAFYPLAFAAERVAGPGAEVVSLTPIGAEPHDLELTPGDLDGVLSADLVVFVAGMQPALDHALRMRRGPVLDVLAVAGVEPLRGPSGTDPHVWLDPRRFALVAREIAAALGPPADSSAFVRELEALDAELERGLANCARRELVTAHAAFGYLADRYRLQQVAISGWSPESEPAPRDLERLVRAARAGGATTIFVEPLVSPLVARTVAREIGAVTAMLQPLEVISAEQAARGETYLSLMRANLAALQTGLSCRE